MNDEWPFWTLIVGSLVFAFVFFLILLVGCVSFTSRGSDELVIDRIRQECIEDGGVWTLVGSHRECIYRTEEVGS